LIITISDNCKNQPDSLDSDKALVNSVRARDEAWEAAQQVLGHSHAIFNTLVNGKKKPVTAGGRWLVPQPWGTL